MKHRHGRRAAVVIAFLAGQAGATASAASLRIYGDSNRDGQVDAADVDRRDDWSWHGPGAFFLANVDDDNRDGAEDASDGGVNSGGDTEDIARLRIAVDEAALAVTARLRVRLDGPGALIRVHERTPGQGSGWRSIGEDGLLARPQGSIELGIEARHFAGIDGWDGRVRVRAEALDATAAVIASDTCTLRVAPWIMLPSSAPTEALYIAQGRYPRAAALLADLRALAAVPVHTYTTDRWQEMWMQDTMEIGYTQMPGQGEPTHVVLRANRCAGCDRFGHTLLARNRGFITVPTEGVTGHGQWDDWLGNVEVSHPAPDWPLGRIYHGINLNRGLQRFLAAQEVQAPFTIDPTWLLIKHVDEVMNFLPGPDGRPRLVIVSPRAAAELRGEPLDRHNRDIQRKLDATIATARQRLGLAADQIVELPLLFTSGSASWSNPVNAVHLNGVVVLGDTTGSDGARTLHGSRQGRAIERLLTALGLAVRWVDDAAYHVNHGNVHCATNALKRPLHPAFWLQLPHAPG